MDYRDLAFGDWIQVERGYDGHLTNERVKGVIGDKDEPYPVTIFTGETVSLNDIKPIPLTEEILVKNGLNWDIIAKFNAALMAYICGEIQCDNDWRTPRIQYVHQLQHLLRLCGIEKEMEL